MSQDEHYRKLVRMYASAPINDYFKPTVQIHEGFAEISLKICSDFHHAAHAVHGSVYFKMLDDAAFFAVNSVVADVFVLTVSFNIYFLRPVAEGKIKATGRVISKSRRLFLAESVLLNSDGKEIARGSGSFIKSRNLLTAEIGYK